MLIQCQEIEQSINAITTKDNLFKGQWISLNNALVCFSEINTLEILGENWDRSLFLFLKESREIQIGRIHNIDHRMRHATKVLKRK